MIQVSTYELTLLIAGFAFGVIFLISILRFLGISGRQNDQRGRRRGRRYDDDDDDYNETYRRRGSGGFMLLLVLVMSVAVILKVQNIDLITTPKEVPTTETAPILRSPINEKPATTPPPQEPKPGLNQDIYMPDAEGMAEAEALGNFPVVPNQKYFIRVCVLSQWENVDPYCQKLLERGLPVCTLEKEQGTAIYIGPYTSWAEAEEVNISKKLKGVIE